MPKTTLSISSKNYSSWCFNYPTLGDLYKYATYDAIEQRACAAAPTT